MRFLYRHDPVAPLTQVYLTVPRSGACLDPPVLQGLSRFALRQMMMGAGGMSHDALSAKLERLGASTAFGLFNDHVTVRLATLTANLDAAVDLLLTSLLQPNFDAEEFARLQSELVSGWIADREESKQLRAQEVYAQRSYDGMPNGYGPDGQLAGLRATTLADVRAQYGRLLGGRDALCAVLTDLPREAAAARVLRRLELPPAAGNGAAAGYPWDDFAPPRRTGRRVTIVADTRTNTDEVVLGGFSVAQTAPDWHLHRLIAFIFGGDMNSRLFRVVRGERGLSYGATCWYDAAAGRGPRDRPAPFTLYTFPSIEHTAEAVPLVLSLYEQLVAEGVSEDELSLARSALTNSHPFKRDTPQKLLALDLEAALYGLATDEEAENRQKLAAVTRADLLRTLQATHDPHRLEIVLLGDPARLQPIAEALPGVEIVETIQYPES